MKMTDMKMQDMKLTDQFAGHEIAGQKDIALKGITLQCSVQFLKRTQEHKSEQQIKLYIITEEQEILDRQ